MSDHDRIWMAGQSGREENRSPLTQHGATTPGENFGSAAGSVAKSQLDPSGADASSTLPTPDTSDHDDPPENLFDAVCRLDDIAEWLREDWPDEAAAVQRASEDLKGYIVIRMKTPASPERGPT